MQVTDLLKIRHGGGQRLVGSGQVTVGPLGKGQQRRGRSAPEVIIRGQKVKRPLPITDRAGDIALRLGLIGTRRGD